MTDQHESTVPNKKAAWESHERPLVIAALLLFSVCLLWIFWAATSRDWAIWAGAIAPIDTAVPANTAAAGAWGDSFGGFNAFIGAIGATAVSVTLYLQYLALQEQRREQHVTRFEENFFRLIELMRTLRENLIYEQTSAFLSRGPDYASQGEHKGHAAIEAAYAEVNHWTFKNHAGRKNARRSIVAAQYNNYVQARYEFCFAPYFRIIYTIMNNIRIDDRLTEEQKAYYANILRSQLTSFEIGLLAFNATSKYSKDLADLITQFRMLKYLPNKRRKVLGKIFDSTAYEPRS